MRPERGFIVFVWRVRQIIHNVLGTGQIGNDH